MSQVFFEQFNIQPDFHIMLDQTEVVAQFAEIMQKLNQTVEEFAPDLIIVVGDVNSTLAAALVAQKKSIPLAHIESGLRSFDRSMPEEINRILTDELAQYFFVTEQSGVENLIKVNTNEKNIFLVGNTMIDTLIAFSKTIDANTIINQLGLSERSYIILTAHRPANVDSKAGLEKLLQLIEVATKYQPVVFPVHPRTLKKIKDFGLEKAMQFSGKVKIIEPLDYFAFQKLVKNCYAVITDSGGIQEETTFLNIPCLTIRPNTERPITLSLGTNTLLEFDPVSVAEKLLLIQRGEYKKTQIPPLWDGRSSLRILRICADILGIKTAEEWSIAS